MLYQRIIRDEAMSSMRERAANDDAFIAGYASGPAPVIDEKDLLNTPIQIADNPPVLVVPQDDTPSSDAENAVRVHSYLRELSNTQAADFRLWTTLSHSTFWDYTRSRWGGAKNLRQSVLEHWFVGKGGKAALRTQSISRLWWAAHLTHAPWERDPELGVFETVDKYKFTRLLLRNQQIYFDLIERDYGSDLRLRICILEAFRLHLETKWKDEISREASKTFNMLVRHRHLALLPIVELRAECDRVVNRVAEQASTKKG